VTENAAKHAVHKVGRKGFAHALEWYYLHQDRKEIYEAPPVKRRYHQPPAKKLAQMVDDMDFSV
jgi:hypothetical protein